MLHAPKVPTIFRTYFSLPLAISPWTTFASTEEPIVMETFTQSLYHFISTKLRFAPHTLTFFSVSRTSPHFLSSSLFHQLPRGSQSVQHGAHETPQIFLFHSQNRLTTSTLPHKSLASLHTKCQLFLCSHGDFSLHRPELNLFERIAVQSLCFLEWISGAAGRRPLPRN